MIKSTITGLAVHNPGALKPIVTKTTLKGPFVTSVFYAMPGFSARRVSGKASSIGATAKRFYTTKEKIGSKLTILSVDAADIPPVVVVPVTGPAVGFSWN